MDNEDMHRESAEEGEITDDSANETQDDFIPLSKKDVKQDELVDQDDEADEAPEELLNRIAEQRANIKMEEESYDPNLCFVCREKPHKYRCPKCDVRTCSLLCIKMHKESQSCDGVRPPFNPVQKMSQFDAHTSIKDQGWMSGIQNKLHDDNKPILNNDAPLVYPKQEEDQFSSFITEKNDPYDEASSSAQSLEQQPRQFPQYINEDGTRNSANSAVERFLLPNAHRRRIFLSFSDDKGEDNSRHEQFSDSIFWCIDIIFRKQQEDGSFSDYSYRIQNIPETIRLCTILRQFLRPRKYGCVVSESDLDLEKLKYFIETGIDGLALFMKVPRFEQERYYVVNAEKTILDNTRNRVIVDHPKFIVIIGNECLGMTPISESEAEELRSKLQKERSSQLGQSGRGRGRGSGRGFHGASRGGPRGGFRGTPFQQRPIQSGTTFPPKRHNNDHHPGPHEWKRGRGEWRGRGRGYNRRNAPNEMDAFDPFEPFKGTNTLPPDYGMTPEVKEPAISLLNWDNISSKLGESTNVRPKENEYVAPDPHNFG